MTLPVKHSVAVMIFKGGEALAIRRREDDDELPGIWGLPAGTRRGAETNDDVIRRIGRDKLGVRLNPVKKLASGVQDRPAYRLEMELWEVSMEGDPTYPEWQWASVDLFRPGAESGSLCCELAIKSRGRVSF
jgi:8-oxo-dGTP diphosphatase